MKEIFRRDAEAVFAPSCVDASCENFGHFVLDPCTKSLTQIIVPGTSSPGLRISNMIFCDKLIQINRVWLCLILELLTPTDLTGNPCWIRP